MVHYRHFIKFGVGLAVKVTDAGYECGYAKTHPKDQYCKATARTISEARLKIDKEVIIIPLTEIEKIYSANHAFLGFTESGIKNIFGIMTTADIDLNFIFDLVLAKVLEITPLYRNDS